YPMADQPSAQWPAGSGVEYLYAAGIWVGAELYGVPAVSTGYPETEFYPSSDPDVKMYELAEGLPGTRRLPQDPDDDGDGLVDEDWPNGIDDDGDGRIDEDYYAIGNQMFSCWYTDDSPLAREVWSEHTPMKIMVRQESFQWGDEYLNDFVCVRYYVTNTGANYLGDLHVGVYADFDAGPRNSGSYHMDDLVDYYEGDWCGLTGEWEWPVKLHIPYVYDANGDDGRTPGYFGLLLLGYTMSSFDSDYQGFDRYNYKAIRYFRGLQPYENGGEPTNDYERFEVLSTSFRPMGNAGPNDYKVVASVGSFGYLPPFETVYVDVAFVAGGSRDEMLDNAAKAMIIYLGGMYDVDGDASTGVDGYESRVLGPAQDVPINMCAWPDCLVDVDEGDTLWVNADCREEIWLWQYTGCYMFAGGQDYYRIGRRGKESRVHYVTGSAPPPPHMRIVPGDGRVSIYWDDFSERVPDPVTGLLDFEGYEIYRADGWTRPLGTTETSGPSIDLWRLYEIRDLVNGLPPDADFGSLIEYGGWRYTPLERLPDRNAYLRAFEESLWRDPLGHPPCPPGMTTDECDTLETMARQNLGFEGGKVYYRVDDETPKNGMHYFYSVIAYDHETDGGVPVRVGRKSSPNANFCYTMPVSMALGSEEYDEEGVYVVPNPATAERMAPWRLDPNNSDPTGVKVEFRNLPACRTVIRIYTIAGDLVQVLHHDAVATSGTCPWNLVSRNGQDVTSGVYLYSVEPADGRFERATGKFVVIR
ncbi:MAG: hypothetical protein JW876_05755, partial [Candidatus Krumholzibacteriota bacterium]|nr:hypothetical protein [Candidatus Krumholzibacteriota bacterium]